MHTWEMAHWVAQSSTFRRLFGITALVWGVGGAAVWLTVLLLAAE